MKNESGGQTGIYVEVQIHGGVDRIWQLTQDPHLHQRWDLRFDRIAYLPRSGNGEPQRFLYETRIGFGLSIKGTGESIGQFSPGGGETTSSLKFASDDPKSLIHHGYGYWRYVPVEREVRFLTWYDYEVRFGAIGRLIDRVAFRPLIGWATAWSFDRLRLWIESDQSPESSINLWFIHAVSRLTIAFIWIWHGLVPKLMFHDVDEVTMLRQAHLSPQWVPFVGAAEIALGFVVLGTWNRGAILLFSAFLMVLASFCVALSSPQYLSTAFNPVTLNLAVLALCVVGWLASRSLPSAARCLRKDPRGQR